MVRWYLEGELRTLQNSYIPLGPQVDQNELHRATAGPEAVKVETQTPSLLFLSLHGVQSLFPPAKGLCDQHCLPLCCYLRLLSSGPLHWLFLLPGLHVNVDVCPLTLEAGAGSVAMAIPS